MQHLEDTHSPSGTPENLTKKEEVVPYKATCSVSLPLCLTGISVTDCAVFQAGFVHMKPRAFEHLVIFKSLVTNLDLTAPISKYVKEHNPIVYCSGSHLAATLTQDDNAFIVKSKEQLCNANLVFLFRSISLSWSSVSFSTNRVTCCVLSPRLWASAVNLSVLFLDTSGSTTQFSSTPKYKQPVLIYGHSLSLALV
ncbi:uncharacterized protein V6R79_000804 [Siganus canaliculatus]